MFEELSKSQPDIAAQLSRQIESNTFTQVNLFGGSRYSLRMTSALESARVLSCKEEGLSSCRCASCRKFDLLTMPNLVIVSQRDHESVIETALASFVRLRSDFSRRFLIRTVRILLLQYHASLSGSSQSATQSANYDAASQVSDLLMELSEEKGEIAEKRAKALSQSLKTALKALLAASRKNTTISVNEVRALDEWINQTSMGEQKRFIIIESLEQTNASARNSLLKMLEEPPTDVYFFLISEYPNRIMQTILSRVRKYSFPPVREDRVNALLSPFFLGTERFATLESFFLQGGGLDLAKHDEVVQTLLDSIANHTYLSEERFSSLVDFVDEQGSYEYVLKTLLSFLGSSVAKGEITWQRASSLSDLISSSYSQATLFNQNKKLMLQALYLKLMEVA
ncbi:hypothetical protein [Sphaerochaeta sp. PS]|uniref:hypothetical protein n=1 Tax=Sphaerochaeta sp. PS TaxID=3076336 RepID=UPI0028A33C93|nr:hypothetical protein [Sphaerochaeta sp. PS]MDT4762940.1 hypothetical protein [Sphaerochaeta sp. PS]